MTTPARYTLYHPKWYRRRVSVWWWLEGSRYTTFVARELTSVFVALVAGVLLLEIRALSQGPEAHGRFLAWLATPGLVAFHVVALAFVLFHSITWFNLAPKAMVVRLGGRRVPDALVAGANYAAWLVLSGAVALLFSRL